MNARIGRLTSIFSVDDFVVCCPGHIDECSTAVDIQIVRRGIPPEALKEENSMTKKPTETPTLKEQLEAEGCKFAGPDHPIYRSGTLILFGSRFVRPPKPVEDAAEDEEGTNG
jgi:hypothetical protein